MPAFLYVLKDLPEEIGQKSAAIFGAFKKHDLTLI
jgi:hypothetical protein